MANASVRKDKPSAYPSQPTVTSIVGAQIRALVAGLNKKNFKGSAEELRSVRFVFCSLGRSPGQLLALHGQDTYTYLLRILLESVDLKTDPESKQAKENLKLQLLAQEVGAIADKPYFASVILRALEGLEMPPHDEAVARFARLLRLNLQQEVALALSFASSMDPKIQAEATKYIKGRLPSDLTLAQYQLPEPTLHNLLYFLRTHDGLAKQEANVVRALQKFYPNSDLSYHEGAAVFNAKVDFKQDAASLIARVANQCKAADLLEDIGYSATASVAALTDVLQQFAPIKETDAAAILAMMVRTHTGLEDAPPLQRYGNANSWETPEAGASWNVNVLVDALKEMSPKLNWSLVTRNLDHPGFAIPDQKALDMLMTALRRASKEGAQIGVFVESWANAKGQLSFLRHALESNDFDWSALRQPTDSNSVPIQWQSPQLVRALLRLAEVENYGVVRSIFERPMRTFPDPLLLTLAKVKRPAFTPLYAELVSPLIVNCLHTGSPVLSQVWAANRGIIVRGYVEIYYRDRNAIARLVDLAIDLKAVPTLLDARPFSFALDFAALVSQRESQFLDKWVVEKLTEHESAFARAIVVFLKERAANGSISGELLTALLRGLQAKPALVPPEMVEDVQKLFAAVQQNPPVSSSVVSSDATKEGDAATGQTKFPPDIEDEANKRFRQIYRGEFTMVQAIQMLKALKESKQQRDELIFLCMIHNLFDEYRFFPKFPEKELQITAVLFGSLIQHQLISYIPLGMALRYVLEALRKSPPSNMFTFGITALEQFRTRLTEWPQYCSHLLQISHLRTARPDIVDFIEKTSRAQQGAATGAQPPLNAQPAGAATGPAGNGAAAAATAAAVPATGASAAQPRTDAPPTKDALMPNYDKLSTLTQTTPSKPLVEPPEAIQDKIYFIINNLSQMNLEQKTAELRGLMRLEWTAWIANYLVVKRVSMEANFHPLYLSFLDRLNLPDLMKEVLTSTVNNVRLLIASEKIKDVSSERALLKHLGSWLGNITIGRNKPLLHRDLYLKGLVLEAFKQGKLSAVVPFLCKILECCKTKLFSYPNVWVTAHLRLLIEIYQIPNLKLNVKIEIELLFTNLNVDMKELKPTTFLKDSISRASAAPGAELPSQGGAGSSGQPPSPHLSGIPQEVVSAAIDRAIKEIITPVVERSGSIACVTTRELILKDFAAEPDETKVRKAAHHMVQSLASSLAMVTCKEPLRVSISNHLRSLLTPSLPQSEQHEVALENSVQAVCADNLDVACAVIEKAAREKAVRDIDEAVGLAFAYTARKKHRESGAQRPFYDMAFVSPRYPATLPENLRPKAGEPYQLRVYEDFSRIARMAAAAANGKDTGGPANNPALDVSPVASPPLVSVNPAAAVPKAPSPTPPPTAVVVAGAAAALAKKGAGLQEQVKAFFEEWLQICGDNAAANDKVLGTYVSNLLNLLRPEDTQANIFRLFADICIEYHDRANSGVQQLSYHTIDLYSKLVVLLVKTIPDPNNKFTLLSSAFSGVVGVLLSDFELKKNKFDQRPYHRLFSNWLQDLMSDSAMHPVNLSIQAFSAAFVRLSPSAVPGFAFAWVELIFSRLFMPKLLLSKSQKGWPMFKRLLVELLRFLEPYLRNAELTEPIRLLYKGTLKALLVLLHDFPEFLCDYHYSFCDVIPPSCIQLRNIILSAFPRHMHLPDPFTPNLKVDRLPEINQAPHILSDFSSAVARTTFKAEIDAFLKTRSPTFFRELKSRILLPAGEQVAAGTKYNVPVLNSLVMYVGVQAISQSKAAKGPSPIIRSAPMEIFQHLATELDTEGRYLFLNSVANQLRYPNTHTHYFSCVLLYLFAEARQEIVKEQITRVLLERLIVNRPHPWGLLITFLEIIKNPRYDFWKNSFTRCDPEIKRLFESVSRTCMGKNKVSDQLSDEHHESAQ